MTGDYYNQSAKRVVFSYKKTYLIYFYGSFLSIIENIYYFI